MAQPCVCGANSPVLRSGVYGLCVLAVLTTSPHCVVPREHLFIVSEGNEHFLEGSTTLSH